MHEGPPRKPTLEQLTSETPVHGLGFERFTDVQKKDVEALLARSGTSLTDPVVKQLNGETIRDIMDYAQLKVNSPERQSLGASILNAVAEARDTEYELPEAA